MLDPKILTTPISTLGLPSWFEAQCGRMGFTKLEEILLLDAAELLNRPGFTYSWLGELSALLTRHGLLHLLQPIPGRNFG